MQVVSSSIPTSLGAGRLEGISVPDLLWNLCRRRATGVLECANRGIVRKVYIAEGQIVFAASSDPDDRLGEQLLREGLIRLEALEQAVQRLHEGKRLGTILVESGHLAPEHLVRSVVAQVRSIVLGLFSWEEGEYRFHEGPLPTEEVITLGMRTAEILLQGIRSIRSFSRIRRSVGSERSRYRATPEWKGLTEGLALSEGEHQLLTRLGGNGETIEALCRDLFLSNFEVFQSLWAFKVLGVVQEVDRALEQAPPGAVEGSLVGGGFPDLLVRLCRAGETGVLRVSRGTCDRTFHVREGRCVFATSSRKDDGLLAHLLRRGIISFRDREETARRLLSNKRVGTILLEMGVIDEGDLARLVKEQVAEIVFDTFRWNDGEWIFASGELPTIEGIVLDRSLEDLVLEGIRRVTSWPRVREGCGGLGTRVVLTPEYLSILDRMTVSPEDWALVAQFRAPRTPLEACATGTLPDFRVCQTLWAMRLLGVLEDAPTETIVDLALDGSGGTGIVDALSEDAPPPAPAPKEPPVPIAPVDVSEGDAFEVTTLDAMDRPEPDDAPAGIPPSEWTEPDEAAEQRWAWKGDAEESGVEISKTDEGDGEIVHDAWEIAAEPAPEAHLDPSVEPEESPEETPAEPGPSDETGFEMRGDPADEARSEVRLPADGLQAEVLDVDRPLAPSADEPSLVAPVEAPPALDERTQQIPREEVERWLRGSEPSPEVEEAEHPTTEPEPEHVAEGVAGSEVEAEPWDPPADLDAAIARFNTRHKALYRVIRSEIGAGAVHFVRNCRTALDPSQAKALGDLSPLADGTWDVEELRRTVCEARADGFAEAFDRLLEEELTRLRPQIGEKRAQGLADLLN